MNETLHKLRSRVGRPPPAQLRLGCSVNENCPVMDIIFTFLRYVDSTWSRGKKEEKSHFSVSVCGFFWVLIRARHWSWVHVTSANTWGIIEKPPPQQQHQQPHPFIQSRQPTSTRAYVVRLLKWDSKLNKINSLISITVIAINDDHPPKNR